MCIRDRFYYFNCPPKGEHITFADFFCDFHDFLHFAGFCASKIPILWSFPDPDSHFFIYADYLASCFPKISDMLNDRSIQFLSRTHKWNSRRIRDYRHGTHSTHRLGYRYQLSTIRNAIKHQIAARPHAVIGRA